MTADDLVLYEVRDGVALITLNRPDRLNALLPGMGAINGPCAGIGFVLAIAADVRFAAPTATMSTSFSRLGLIAEYGVAWLLTRLVGLAHATELLLSGRTLTGEEVPLTASLF